MWEKILAQLATKHPGVSKSVLGLLAKKLADKVTEESQIEGVITDYETNSPISIKEYADFVQQQGDTRVTEAKKKWETENKKPGSTESEKKDVAPDDMPEWAKQLQQSVTILGQQFAQKSNESTMEALIAKAKEKGIPEAYVRKTAIGDSFDLDSALSTLESEWTEIKQANLNATVAGEKVIAGVKTDAKAVSSAIANFAKSNLEAASAAKN